MHVKFESIKKSDFRYIFYDMQKQFPKAELKSYDEYEELLDSNKYKVFYALENGIKIGYVLFAEVENVIWLDYVAVFEKFHSKGYGSQIIEAMKTLSKDALILEVEPKDEKIPNTLRRIKFYEKLGAHKLNIEYYYPNKNGCINLDLYEIKYNKNANIDYKLIIEKAFEMLHSYLTHYKYILNKISINET